MCLREVAVVLHTRRFSQSWNRDFTNEDSGSYPGTTGWTRILFVLAQQQISRVVSCWEGSPDLHALSWPLIAESQARVHNISLVELSNWKLGRCLSASLPSASVLWQKETALGAPEIQHSSNTLTWLILAGSCMGVQPGPAVCWPGAELGLCWGYAGLCWAVQGCAGLAEELPCAQCLWLHSCARLAPQHAPAAAPTPAQGPVGPGLEWPYQSRVWSQPTELQGFIREGEKRLN